MPARLQQGGALYGELNLRGITRRERLYLEVCSMTLAAMPGRSQWTAFAQRLRHALTTPGSR